MQTVCDLVAEAKVAASRASAKLLLQRTGGAGPVESPEADVERVLVLLGRIDKAATATAVRARYAAAGVAGMLTPSGPCCGPDPAESCGDAPARNEATTTRLPRVGAVVITDVIDGTFADLAERIEAAR